MIKDIDLVSNSLKLATPIENNEDLHLPDAQLILLQKNSQLKLDELYPAFAFNTQIIAAFAPNISTDKILNPALMNSALYDIYESLSTVADADIRVFLREDLKHLLDNKELFNLYSNMMINA